MGEWSQNSSGRVARTWKNLADSFGPRFLRDFGNEAPPIWVSAIQSLKDHEIEKGFRRLALHGSASPPTLPQFMKFCKMTGDDEGTLRPAATFQPQKSLAAPSNKFFAKGSVLLLKYILENETPTTEVDALRAIMKRAADDYLAVSRECEVSFDEFQVFLYKQFDGYFQRQAA